MDVLVASRKPLAAVEAFLTKVASLRPAPVWYEETYYTISSSMYDVYSSSLTRFSNRRLFLW